jgi:hypothetical protein
MFTQFDVLLWCFVVVVVVSLLCKAGKQFVWWLVGALALFLAINVLFNVLSGGDKWGLASPKDLIEGSRRVAGESLYETVVFSEAFTHAHDKYTSWRGGAKDIKSPPPLPPPPPPPEASSGWQFPWG